MPKMTMLYIFKKGIKPMWSDESNKEGGKFNFSIKRYTDIKWESLLIMILGRQIGEEDSDICGLTLSIRSQEDFISVWTKNSENSTSKSKIKSMLLYLLNETPNYNTEIRYKYHYNPNSVETPKIESKEEQK